MSTSKRAIPADVDWTGVRVHRVPYAPGDHHLAQGDPATRVMYVEAGAVRLSVLSHSGKEAVIAVLDVDHFFGEGWVVAIVLFLAALLSGRRVVTVDAQRRAARLTHAAGMTLWPASLACTMNCCHAWPTK